MDLKGAQTKSRKLLKISAIGVYRVDRAAFLAAEIGEEGIKIHSIKKGQLYGT